jgi:NO-binding membrane sensor protein with MHYT domain
MTTAKHFTLFVQGLSVWALFWLAGLPYYYQQYSPISMAVVCILLSVAIAIWGLWILLHRRSETRLSQALWTSFYFTIPFAILDWLYCGIYQGHGAAFLVRYWYLTVFYVTPWLTLVPTALLLRHMHRSQP